MENDEQKIIDGHKKFGPDLCMLAWELIEKKDRTPEESDTMLNAVHASAYHWSQLKGHVDDNRWKHSFAISHHQIALVYVEIGNATQALYHAHRCLEYFQKYGVGGFPDAYGYDVLARAYNLIGDVKNRNDAIRKAIDAGNRIEEKQFRDSFFAELAQVQGYEDIVNTT